MARVATIPLQRTMSSAIQRSQEKLAITQAQLSTGKKATTFADLGTETVRNLSAHSMLSRQQAQATVSKRVDTTLSLYQGSLEAIDTAAGDLRTSILSAIGTGKADGLQEAVQSAFHQYRSALNLSEGGAPLFGGAQTNGSPFKPQTLADVAAADGAAAFQDDEVRSTARIADGVDITYGISASAAGKDLYDAFRTLAQAGPFSEEPTAGQITALKTAMDQLDKGLASTRSVNAENGRKQAQVETLAKRNDERAVLLSAVIESNEDADLGQVAIDLAQQKTVLEASYSVFSQLSGLSLVNYLR
ncbi:flagellin [Sphingomonas xinjiangensis]|uniref:Flagellar hook-associated protein 3 FlgL n=1 Tax=Sphingomonas xinjiangensis TaxID=643568 RepID=A0A840YQ43_9SPHN|nr:flagellin [Sphingomonas xinjiangensis]MBB5710781.1 flagellar hook-associated protein 3 FlgL [Sphingomonas xinjiangensis]